MSSYNVHDTLSPFMCGWDFTGKQNDELNTEFGIYNLIYNNHYNYLVNILGSLFKWTGLPPAKNGKRYRSTFFEMMLATQGTCCIAYTAKYGMVISPCVTDGLYDFTGNPTTIRLYPNYNQNMYAVMDYELKEDDGDTYVFCRNDNIGSGILPLVVQVANMLTNVMMSMIVNADQQKFPTVITGNKNNKMSMRILADKIGSWEKFIFLEEDGGLQPEKVDVLNRNIPYVSDKLYGSYMDILNNFFMRIGINTIPYAKKERLLSDEVNSNNQAVQTSGDIYMGARQEICDDYNDMFGKDYGELSVERNVDLAESLAKSVSDARDRFDNDWGDDNE